MGCKTECYIPTSSFVKKVLEKHLSALVSYSSLYEWILWSRLVCKQKMV